MKLVDTHCHPQFPQYDTDRERVIKNALDDEIGMICVGTDAEMSQKAIELASKHDHVWASVGLHPNDELDEKYDHNQLVKLADHDKVVAIGEVGLDYYRTTEHSQRRTQKQRLEKQINFSQNKHIPLIIHCRDGKEASAHKEMIDLLFHWRYRRHVEGVIHSFTGTWEQAKRYLDSGFYIGLNGIITFTDQYDDTVLNIPLNRVLLETDAPFLTPHPHRGQRNDPSYVRLVAEHLAKKRGLTFEQVTEATTSNARNLFGI